MPTTTSRRSLRAVLAALLAMLVVPAGALAHGDMSSHYLETGSLYPSAQQPSEAVGLQLLGYLDAAKAAGYPVKVGIVADESDVADRPQMLKRPQAYAEFVVAALAQVRVNVEAPVVIVTPYGVGVSGAGVNAAEAEALARGIAVSRGVLGDELAKAAMAAIRKVAQAGGHPLPANVPPAKVALVRPPDSSSGYDLKGLTPVLVFAVIFGGAALLFEVRSRAARRAGSHAAVTPSTVRETGEPA
jgi:hypothetical protein